MITAVDTNILLDVVGADPEFGMASAEALRRCIREGAIVACGAVWAETAAVFPDDDRFNHVMEQVGIRFLALTQESALAAGGLWRAYRAKGGPRDRVVADFLIGAHAMLQCDRLLTRDRGFYRRYFRKLKVLEPARP